MSLDTQFADPIRAMSPWEQLKAQMFAAREIAADALRRELAAQPAVDRTPQVIQADIDRYTAQLKVEPVYKNLHWFLDVRNKLTAAQAELDALTGGVR